MSTQFQKRPSDHGNILFFDILLVDRFFYIVEIVMQSINEQFLKLVQVL